MFATASDICCFRLRNGARAEIVDLGAAQRLPPTAKPIGKGQQSFICGAEIVDLGKEIGRKSTIFGVSTASSYR